jgi:hypothetical protein
MRDAAQREPLSWSVGIPEPALPPSDKSLCDNAGDLASQSAAKKWVSRCNRIVSFNIWFLF